MLAITADVQQEGGFLFGKNCSGVDCGKSVDLMKPVKLGNCIYYCNSDLRAFSVTLEEPGYTDMACNKLFCSPCRNKLVEELETDQDIRRRELGGGQPRRASKRTRG